MFRTQVTDFFSFPGYKTILKELKQYLEILQLTNDEELSELLLAATVVREELLQKEIIDKKRIKIILRNIEKKSKIKKIDSKLTNKIWKSMIRAFIDYEFRKFKRK